VNVEPAGTRPIIGLPRAAQDAIFSLFHFPFYFEKDGHMNQPVLAKKHPSLSRWSFCISLLVLVASCVAFGIFMHLNRTIKVTGAKVVDTYSKKAFASRKQTYDQEYEVIRYTIGGKEFTGTVAAPRQGASQYATVFYYEKFPQFAWYNKRSNPNETYCALVAVLAAAIMAFSLQSMRKRPEAAAMRVGTKSQQRKA
jgi:hypothetical protein